MIESSVKTTTVEKAEVPTNENNQLVISVEGILSDLDNGLDREQIGARYGLTKAEVREMFKHPRLKGKKPKKQSRFILVDSSEALSQGISDSDSNEE